MALMTYPCLVEKRPVGIRGRDFVFGYSAQGWVTLGYALEDWSHREFRHQFPRELVQGLRTMFGNPRRRHFRVTPAEYQRLLAVECAVRGISLHLALNSHKRDGARARMRVWRALNNRGMSLPAIGKLAGRDHSTILSGIRRIDFEEGKAGRP